MSATPWTVDPPTAPPPVGGGAGAMGAGGWLMPSLGIALKLLGMVGGKKSQNVLAMHNAFGPSGLGQLFGSNNPFLGNEGEDPILGGKDTDKKNQNPMSIGGNFMDLPGANVPYLQGGQRQ